MKINHILFLVSAIAFTACQSGENEGQPAENAARLVSEKNSIRLNTEQINLAGIVLGLPEQRQLSDYVECTGKVEVPPQNLASVYSPVHGFVKMVKHLPGDYVKKGSLLTIVEHPELVRLQREFLESKSRLVFFEKDYQRKLTLAETEAASRKALDQAEADFRTELARCNGLQAELELIGIQTRQLEETGNIQPAIQLYAPISGYVTKVQLNTGKLVSPQDQLYELIDKSHMHLELQIFAKDVAKVKKGQRIDCFVPGREQPIHADVYLVGQMIDPETKTTMVHGHFTNEPVPLIPGTFVQAHIFTDEKETMTVPVTAIIREGEERYLFVQRNGAFEKISVKTGRTDGDYVEIEPFGLQEGDRVALKGAYYINGSLGEETE